VANGDYRSLLQLYNQALLLKIGSEETINQVHGSLNIITI